MSRKSYGILRVGTLLGEHMPKQTAASIFIDSALRGEPITPYRHTQHRPMLFVDIHDACKALETFATMVLRDDSNLQKTKATVVNLVWPRPVTIIELARIIKARIRLIDRKREPKISVIDKGIRPLYAPRDKNRIRVDISKARKILGMDKLVSPQESIERILLNRVQLSDGKRND